MEQETKKEIKNIYKHLSNITLNQSGICEKCGKYVNKKRINLCRKCEEEQK